MTGGVALITGISGQDGSYLAELLLEKGYRVHGLVRDGRLGAAAHLADRLEQHPGDVRDHRSLTAAVTSCQPDEVYHLAAVTAPGRSWEDPAGTFDVVAGGTVRLLQALHEHARGARFFLAGSAEVYGVPASAPQDEEAPFSPRNPYGAAKAGAIAAARAFRSGAGLFAGVGILFNHESPRRPLDFLPRKVSWHAAAIATGREEQLRLGDLDARRDWGSAPDYMDGAWRVLQADRPADYVFATGRLHSVRELVDIAFARAGVAVSGRVVVDEQLVRRDGPVPLVGDAGKARRELGWEPTTSFEDLIATMVDADLQAMSA
ncbi:MAG: GDP-mannose 4,6-dehydratase [Solirubrobacteraceae bacterium]